MIIRFKYFVFLTQQQLRYITTVVLVGTLWTSWNTNEFINFGLIKFVFINKN